MHKLLMVLSSVLQELNTEELLFILRAEMAFYQPLTDLSI